jgi:hypothetical protein
VCVATQQCVPQAVVSTLAAGSECYDVVHISWFVVLMVSAANSVPAACRKVVAGKWLFITPVYPFAALPADILLKAVTIACCGRANMASVLVLCLLKQFAGQLLAVAYGVLGTVALLRCITMLCCSIGAALETDLCVHVCVVCGMWKGQLFSGSIPMYGVEHGLRPVVSSTASCATCMPFWRFCSCCMHCV